ncbi:MAG TPA: acyl-CoA dehydrogenase family protein [Methylomirabilota bacterium]|nr:acyl-CoA dehydrogenase family protein [Methylomirabilota bacterium]
MDRYGERAGALTARDAESEDRRQIVLAVRQFVDKELVPVAAEQEHAGHVPASILTALAELGILGAVVPPPLGGLGLDAATHAMVIEELARGWATIATTVADHACVASAIARFGGGQMRERLLPAMTRGERLGALAAGDLRARRDGDAWIVSGATSLVANATRAGVFVLGARADDARALRLVIEPDARGLTIGEVEATVGGRGLDPARLTLDGVRVPTTAVLDDAGDTLGAAADLGAAATALGIAQAAFEAALRYSQQRTTFGKPICQHQAVQLKLADMATGITATRLLVSAAADRLDAGEPATAALARRQATEVVGQVTLEAMRIHGGYGYTTEFPVERYYRDATRFLAGD